MEIKKQNAEIILQNNELKQGLTQSRQQVEELDVRVHQVQERNFTRLGTSIPSTAAISEKNVLTPPKEEELCCTVDFSRASEGKEINIAEIRKKVEEEVQESDKAFYCKAVLRDQRT